MKIKLLHGPLHDWEIEWPDDRPLEDWMEWPEPGDQTKRASYKRSSCPPNLSGGVQYYYFAMPGKRLLLHAILDDELRVVETEDLMAWAMWFERNDEKRRVAWDSISGFIVSTIFMGINHGHGRRPIWFETMVFREGIGDRQLCGSIDQARYSTWNEAVEGHAKICEQVRKGEIGE